MTTAFRFNYMNIKKSKEICNDSNNELEKEIKELEQLLEDLPFPEPINKSEKNDPISQGDKIRIFSITIFLSSLTPRILIRGTKIGLCDIFFITPLNLTSCS